MLDSVKVRPDDISPDKQPVTPIEPVPAEAWADEVPF